MKSKKKFSTEKYILWVIKKYVVEPLIEDSNNEHKEWFVECDGLTEQEMLEKGFVTRNDWME